MSDSWLDDGERLLQQGKFAPAIVELQRAVALKPGAARGHYLLGSAYAAASCPAAAEDAYRAALGLWPEYPDAHFALGRLLALEQRTEEAIAALEAAVRLRPAYAEAGTALSELLNARAQGLLSAGRFPEALALTQR